MLPFSALQMTKNNSNVKTKMLFNLWIGQLWFQSLNASRFQCKNGALSVQDWSVWLLLPMIFWHLLCPCIQASLECNQNPILLIKWHFWQSYKLLWIPSLHFCSTQVQSRPCWGVHCNKHSFSGNPCVMEDLEILQVCQVLALLASWMNQLKSWQKTLHLLHTWQLYLNFALEPRKSNQIWLSKDCKSI